LDGYAVTAQADVPDQRRREPGVFPASIRLAGQPKPPAVGNRAPLSWCGATIR